MCTLRVDLRRWALAGFLVAEKSFLETGDFRLSDAHRANVDVLLAASDSVAIFVRERVEWNEGSSVTSGELVSAYAEFCADRGWDALPETIVQRLLSDCILGQFHAAKSNSVKSGDGPAQRGWRNLALRGAS